MKHDKEELAVMTALVERFTSQRLPRLREIKSRVDQGEKLDERDLEYLEMMLADAKKAEPRVKAFPELNDVVAKAIGLYHEVTSKALENEKGS